MLINSCRDLNFFCLSIARYYINYKLMKKMLKQYVQQTQIGGKDCEQILKEFSRILDDQVCRKLISRSDLSILSLVPLHHELGIFNRGRLFWLTKIRMYSNSD
jgi:hypothetical protein